MNRKIATVRVAVFVFGAIFVMPSSAWARRKKPEKHPAKTETKSMPDQPIACSLLGLTEQQRKRQQELRTLLFEAGRDIQELPDGYAIGLPATAAYILAAAEFVTLERLCCPFFRFELAVGATTEPAWLRLTGGKDVKEFLKSQLIRR